VPTDIEIRTYSSEPSILASFNGLEKLINPNAAQPEKKEIN